MLRFARSRSFAQKWVGEGHIRRNSARVERCNQPVCVGDVLTLPLKSGVIAIELLSLPQRRGPPSEARAHYLDLDAQAKPAIARPQWPSLAHEETEDLPK